MGWFDFLKRNKEENKALQKRGLHHYGSFNNGVEKARKLISRLYKSFSASSKDEAMDKVIRRTIFACTKCQRLRQGKIIDVDLEKQIISYLFLPLMEGCDECSISFINRTHYKYENDMGWYEF